jgi:hypothetical protein
MEASMRNPVKLMFGAAFAAIANALADWLNRGTNNQRLPRPRPPRLSPKWQKGKLQRQREERRRRDR